MQNLLLLHLREQRRLTPKKIEAATGISLAQYMEYEQGKMHMSQTDADLLGALLNVKSTYLKTYSEQLEFFHHTAGIMAQKDKRAAQLTRVLKRYIKKAPGLAPKSLKLP